MKLIAMIPARLGSQRIPRKNLRYLGEKPLLQYPIELSLSSGLFDEVWVNSESQLIGQLAEKCGARFHLRPEALGSNTATNQQFTEEFLQHRDCDYVFMVNSTSPLLRPETLKDFVAYVKKQQPDTCLSVVSDYAEIYFNDQPLNFSFAEKINSQNLPPIQRVVWAVTAWKRSSFLAACESGQCGTFSGVVDKFEIPRDESCDLDTPEDWRIAEGLLLARKNDLSAQPAKFWGS